MTGVGLLIRGRPFPGQSGAGTPIGKLDASTDPPRPDRDEEGTSLKFRLS
jgi:hypothetical protein